MIANLPLLFAGGNPTSLEKMTSNELEVFITFLVHCSWGHDTATNIQQPQWWPSDVPFSDPFVRPQFVPKDWTKKLCTLVRKCYSFHNSEFLLKFSEDLAQNPPSTLKFVDNFNLTTSLYLKSSNRLLVTFRNENMLYDKKIEGSPRKCLLPRKQNNTDQASNEIIDVYLCDTCDEAFEDSDEYQKHEKLCSQKYEEMEAEASETQPTTLEEVGQTKFFELFGLQTTSVSMENTEANSIPDPENQPITLVESNKRQKRDVLFRRLANLPFSSLAGRRLYSKGSINSETSNRQKELVEKCCAALPLDHEYPRWMYSRSPRSYPQKKYRRPEKYWSRTHLFHGQRNKIILNLEGQLNFLKCRELSVNVTPLTSEEIEHHLSKKDPPVDPLEFVSVENVQTLQTCSFSTDDIIDLCSDDEPSESDACVSENVLPNNDSSNNKSPNNNNHSSNNDDKTSLCPVKLESLANNKYIKVYKTKLKPLQKYHDNFLNSQANSKQVILID